MKSALVGCFVVVCLRKALTGFVCMQTTTEEQVENYQKNQIRYMIEDQILNHRNRI